MESRKNDIIDNKLRWDLLPLAEIEDVVKVYHFGAKKYAPNSWQNLEDYWNRYKGALLRHLSAIEDGEFKDVESGLLHTSHIIWNAIALNYGLKNSKLVLTKDIPGYEDYYYADTEGNIYSKDRYIKGGKQLRKGRKLSPAKTNKGYLRLNLSNKNSSCAYSVHRLIAMTFLPNPNNLPEINHINSKRDDNRLINLEWCDRDYNVSYAKIKGAYKLCNRSKEIMGTPVFKMSIKGKILKEYDALIDVAEDKYDPSFVAKVCKGEKELAYGFKWIYKKDYKI